jgi:predicted RNA binding protein YcfA (HicA-like mRNA interferase family)
VNGKQIKKILEEAGWMCDRIKGSHHVMIKDGHRSIPVPVHGSKDLPLPTAKAILKQAGIE